MIYLLIIVGITLYSYHLDDILIAYLDDILLAYIYDILIAYLDDILLAQYQYRNYNNTFIAVSHFSNVNMQR